MRSKHFLQILFVLSLVFVGSVFYVFSDVGVSHYFTGQSGLAHVRWTFETEYGNAGRISFSQNPGPIYPKANLQWTGITGFFWSETTGWAEFTGGTYIIPRALVNGVRETWDASGWVWSDHAGWLTLSGVEYYPDTATLSGWLWGNTLGWVSLDTLLDNVWLGFVGSVKFIGNVWGKNIYSLNLANYEQWAHFDISTVATVINNTRKKVTLNLRNVASSLINTVPGNTNPAILNGAVYYSYTGSAPDFFVSYSTVEWVFNTVTSPRSLVVVWWDIYVDTGIILPNNTPTHALIALKNEFGVWGNIYIRGDVTKIQSSLIAEWSIYSARRLAGAWKLYNADKLSTTNLPNYQLYIKWSVISRNTIWGAGTAGNPHCPYTETAATCTYDQALRYDLNYFRDFQSWATLTLPDTLARHRGYLDATLDNKSLIVEYDTRMMIDAPPGL